MIDARLRLVSLGALVGLALASLAAFGLSKVIFGVDPADPVVLAGVSLVITSVELIASVLPSRAATRVNPVDEMRVG